MNSYLEYIDESIYDDIDDIYHISGVLELEARGISPPKYILDLVPPDRLSVIKYFVNRCYSISKTVTNSVLEGLDVHQMGEATSDKEYLSYVWFHTTYEFDFQVSKVLESTFGNRNTSLDVVMEEWISSM